MIKLNKLYIAIAATLVGIICVDSYGVIIKSLGQLYPITQLNVFRNGFAVLPLLAVFIITKEFPSLFKNLNFRFIIICFVRGICFALMHVFYFAAIINMDFATASTLTFSSPFFIALLSIFFLGDKVGIYRWLAIIIGFIGVVMIMRPDTDLFSIYSIFPILVALLFSIAMIILRFIPDSYSTSKIQFYSLLFSIIGAILLFLISDDHVPVENYNHLLLMVLTGVLGGIAAILFIFAYRLVSPSKLATFEYVGIPSSFLLGWIFFNELPISQLFPGVIAIVFAGMIIIWRDTLKEKLPREIKQ